MRHTARERHPLGPERPSAAFTTTDPPHAEPRPTRALIGIRRASPWHHRPGAARARPASIVMRTKPRSFSSEFIMSNLRPGPRRPTSSASSSLTSSALLAAAALLCPTANPASARPAAWLPSVTVDPAHPRTAKPRPGPTASHGAHAPAPQRSRRTLLPRSRVARCPRRLASIAVSPRAIRPASSPICRAARAGAPAAFPACPPSTASAPTGCRSPLTRC